MGRRVYLTGFEPFLAIRENPTEELALALNGRRFGDLSVTGRVLPVSWERTPTVLLRDRAHIQPDLCLHLGVSGQAEVIRLERFAYNTIRSSFPDNADELPEEQPIEDGRPIESTRETPIPLGPLLEQLKTDGVPSELSIDPGRYLCNRAYYESLRLEAAPSLFVHVPHTHNRDPSGAPWTIERLRAATESILQGLNALISDSGQRYS